MTEPQTASIILHVGAPKCGSSALQTALSQQPGLPSGNGPPLAYTALRAKGSGWTPITGRLLRAAAARSVHGYAGWPETREADPVQLFEALDRVRRKAGRSRPVVSNEGWIAQSAAFAEALPHWFDAEAGGGPVEICAFARPPIDWLNAAYWQWGVWSGRSFGTWLERLALPYAQGSQLAAWAALPNTRLRLDLRGDALAGFEAAYDVTLPRPEQRNAALPPALQGFLMRNRRYRTDAHDTAAEFVFQRWCRVENAPRLWAVLPRHLRVIREITGAEVDQLLGLLPAADAEALRSSDPRWTSAEPYHAQLRRGLSVLDDPEELAQLYRALVRGVARAAEAAGRAAPPLQPVLSTRASAQAWDVAVAQALEHLLSLDADLRRRRLPFGL